jgi:Flp pilus assembly protein TadG
MTVGKRSPVKRRFTRFLRGERGTGTIEFLIWCPFILAFFFLMLEASTIFLHTNAIRRIVQDGNRQYVRGVTVTAVVDATSGQLTTKVSFPSTDVDIAGWSKLLPTFTIYIRGIEQTES